MHCDDFVKIKSSKVTYHLVEPLHHISRNFLLDISHNFLSISLSALTKQSSLKHNF